MLSLLLGCTTTTCLHRSTAVAHLKNLRDINREGPIIGGVDGQPVKAGVQLADSEAFSAQVLLQLTI